MYFRICTTIGRHSIQIYKFKWVSTRPDLNESCLFSFKYFPLWKLWNGICNDSFQLACYADVGCHDDGWMLVHFHLIINCVLLGLLDVGHQLTELSRRKLLLAYTHTHTQDNSGTRHNVLLHEAEISVHLDC